ncbi:TetR/AcrR family transcriptional regulator [Tissierella praeacuta]|uniref:TetR/AcrR family transcriptional regulator n=1 Tax=Tissierella praeacuta TaxID=43131 RepID=UPI001C108022|nr:TetR/AcrR family transcriptional regulator [Tissierella praeacuta]MBU5257211.1 TetR/AcrR family transcriptional regulator [Tissierella praeacuta]
MISQSELKYSRVIKKAEELFLKLGYKATSMDQIAEESGVSKMTIYKYFPSKEELFIQIILSIMNRYFNDMKNEIDKIEGTLDRIDFLLNFGMEHSKQYSMALYKDIFDNPYIYEKLMEEKKRMARIIFEDIVREGVNKGEIRNIDEAFIANILIALIKGIDKEIFDDINSNKELEDFTEKLYDFLKYGLLGR